PMNRVLMSYFASVYVNLILWMGIRDCTAGFKCYHRNVLRAIDLSDIRFIGYAFQIEMKYKAQRLGFKAKEVPITFVDRQFGESKMSMGIFKEAFWGVLKMRFMPVKRAK
ncbi:MAG: polyprenol monophosphomannose synthase, partial [Flavobacteriales bacterium]|nr:polyprenol monophosphomannose synthase [Flavobacteriales bacterium]